MVWPLQDGCPYYGRDITGYSGKALVVKCDVDSSPGVSAKYGIRNIPTILFFKDGKIADKQVGAVPKANFVTKA